MKDIDFDELDKAVSSLLGEAQKEPKTQKNFTDSLNTHDDHQISNSNTEEQIGTHESDTIRNPGLPSVVDSDGVEKDTPLTSSQPNLVEKRSKGRFMDVVHPSSDMRNLQKPSVPRTAPDILPVESSPESDKALDDAMDRLSAVPEDNFDFGAKSSSPADELVDEIAIGSEDDEHTQPDPLDFHGFLDGESVSDDEKNIDISPLEENITPTDEAEGLDEVTSDLAEVDSLLSSRDQNTPLETPFVSMTDTPEKRPLGAFSSIQPSDVEDGEGSNMNEQNVELSDKSPVSTKPTDEVSSELSQSDQDPMPLQSIEDPELTEDSELPNADESLAEAELQTVPEPDTTPEELREDLVSIEAAEVTAANPVTALSAVGSIPQQYTTKAVAQHTEPTAVFDTDQYHQPLKHAPKKKSGIGTVILVIALIIVGAGGGAAFYFFDPFHLFS